MALSDEQIEAIFKSVDSEDKGRFAIVRLFARAIEAEARRDALTEAERVCDHYATALDGGSNEYTRSRECMLAANAIRALKGLSNEHHPRGMHGLHVRLSDDAG
jgi:hypothetical protein